MIKCSRAQLVQYGMTITQGRCCQQLTEITYIAKHIYYALTDGKTDWSCHKSPKHERRDWLRLIDSIKTFGAFLGAWGGGGGQSDVWFFLACHLLVITWQEAPFLLAIHVAYLTHFRKPVLMLAMAVDGVRGVRWARAPTWPLSSSVGGLFCGSRLACCHFVTRHLRWCHKGHPHRTLASWAPSLRLVTSQPCSRRLPQTPRCSEIWIELHSNTINKDIGK